MYFLFVDAVTFKLFLLRLWDYLFCASGEEKRYVIGYRLTVQKYIIYIRIYQL